MRRFLVRAALCVCFVIAAAGNATAQIGKSVAVAAGTPEDKALTDIYAATDGPDKTALLDKFMADYGKGDMELLGDQLYVQSYLAQKNYAKVYEYGDKVLALDPDNFSTAVIMVHAAEEQGDTPVIASFASAGAARAMDTPSPRQRRAIILMTLSFAATHRLSLLPRGTVVHLFGGNTPARPMTGTQIFAARHVGPFGPNAGSIRKLSFSVIAPSGKAPSGMTSVAWSPTNMITCRFCSSNVFAIARKPSK